MQKKNKIIFTFILFITVLTVLLFSCIKKPNIEEKKEEIKLVDKAVIDNFTRNFTERIFPRDLTLDKDLYYDINISVDKENSKKENYKIYSYASYKNSEMLARIEDKTNNEVIYYDGNKIYKDKVAKDGIEFKKIIDFFFIKEEGKNYEDIYYSSLSSYFYNQFSFFFDQLFLGILPSQINIKIDDGLNISETQRLLNYIYDPNQTYEKGEIISIKTKDLDTSFLSFLPLDFIKSVKDLKSNFNKANIQFVLNKKTNTLKIFFNIKEERKLTLVLDLNNIVKEAQPTEKNVLKNLNKTEYKDEVFYNKNLSFKVEAEEKEEKNIMVANLLISFNPNTIFEYLSIEKERNPKILNISTKNIKDYSKINNKIVFEIKDKNRQLLLFEYNPKKYKNESVNFALNKDFLEKILRRKNNNISIKDYIKDEDVIDGYLLFQTSLDVFLDNMPLILVAPNNISNLFELLKKENNNSTSPVYPILEFLEVLNRTAVIDKNGVLELDKENKSYKKIIEKYNINGPILTLLKYLPGEKYKIYKIDDKQKVIDLSKIDDIRYKKFKVKEILKLKRENLNEINLKNNSLTNPFEYKSLDNFIDEYLNKDGFLEVEFTNEENNIIKSKLQVNSSTRNKVQIIEKHKSNNEIEKYAVYEINLLVSAFSNNSVFNILDFIYLRNEKKGEKIFPGKNITFYIMVKQNS